MATTTSLYARHAQPLAAEALDFSPVVFIQGARQVGKSTLAQQVMAERSFEHALTLDSQAELDAASNDPVGFLAGLEGRVFIDEVQRAPALLLARKSVV